jgi:hypothetical protein
MCCCHFESLGVSCLAGFFVAGVGFGAGLEPPETAAAAALPTTAAANAAAETDMNARFNENPFL